MDGKEGEPVGNGVGDHSGMEPATGEGLHVALQTAESLLQLLQDLEQEARTLEARRQDLEVRARQLEESSSRLDAFKLTVRDAANAGVKREDVAQLGELVDALARKPSDLLVMVKISEQADKLAAVVRAQSKVLDALEPTG